MNDYVKQITSLANQRKGSRPLFIAIDGHSAAGKSTLARNLSHMLDDAAAIYTDDFYRPMPQDRRFDLNAEDGYEYYYDWQRLKQEVLEPLSVSNVAEFRIYDWSTNRLGEWKIIYPGDFIIVEGCYSARPELNSFFNIVVLVETSVAVRQRRQAKRNDASQEWLDRWDAAERFYIETTNLRNRADIIVAGFTGR